MPQKTPTLGDVLTVREAAPLVRKSPRALYRAIRLGLVPPGVFFKIGRDVYVARDRLLAWRDAGGAAAEPLQPAA